MEGEFHNTDPSFLKKALFVVTESFEENNNQRVNELKFGFNPHSKLSIRMN